MSDSIRIITTGGTIDSELYDSLIKKSVFTRGSYMPDILNQARVQIPINVEELMQKDSLDITEADRGLMLERCNSCQEDRIIITHGTATMAETSKYLGPKIQHNKAIILVGSMVQFSQPNSDASFNVGFAIGALLRVDSGVYVAMNGDLFPWDNVQEDKEHQIFERERE